MRYYDTLATFQRGGFTIIVDKSWEDLSPRDCFDDSECEIEQIIKDIDRGHLEWFVVRVRAMVEDFEMGSAHLGGMLYEDPRECLTDGSVEDLIHEAMAEAKSQVYTLSKKFTELSYALDAQGVTV